MHGIFLSLKMVYLDQAMPIKAFLAKIQLSHFPRYALDHSVITLILVAIILARAFTNNLSLVIYNRRVNFKRLICSTPTLLKVCLFQTPQNIQVCNLDSQNNRHYSRPEKYHWHLQLLPKLMQRIKK